jgi:putative flippase GtrA
MLGQLASFGAIGAVTTYVDLAVFNLVVGTLQAVPANVCGYGTGMIVGWLLNRRYTFGSVSHRRLGLPIFVGVSSVGLALTSVAVHVAALLAPGDRFLLNVTKLGAGSAIMLLKFGLLRRWVTAARVTPATL